MLQNIKKLLGTFWFQIFKDTWLVQNILKLYDSLIIQRFECLQQNLKARLGLSSQLLYNHYDYKELLLQTTYSYVDDNLSQLQDNTFADTIKISSPTDKLRVRLIGNYLNCTKLTADINSKNKVQYLQLNKDYQIVDGYLELTQFDFSRIAKHTVLVNSSQGLKKYYRVWGLVPVVDLADTCCTILGFPVDWLVKYPVIVKKAFYAHFNGLSKQSAVDMLNQVIQNPKCITTGVVKSIQKIGDTYHVAIQNTVYTSKYQPAVIPNTIVAQGTFIFKSPVAKVLDYKTDFTAQGIQNLKIVSQAGIINLKNAQLDVQITNVLPGTQNTQYQQLCSKQNNRPKAQLGSAINPMLYVIKKLWRHLFVLIKLPAFSKNSDLDILLKFILKNIPNSCIVLVQPELEHTQICQLDLQCVQTKVNYYSKYNKYDLEVQFENI